MYNLLLQLHRHKHFPEMEREARALLQTAPRDANLRLLLGIALLTQGKHSECRKIFKKLLREHSGNHEARRMLAAVLRKEGKLQEALQHLRHLHTACPQDCRVVRDYGHVLTLLQKCAEAVSVLQTGMALQCPEHEDIAFNLALALDAAGRHSKACELYQEIVRSNSRHAPEAALKLASLLREQGDVSSATAVLEALRTAGQLQADSAFLLASLYAETEAYAKARDVLEAVSDTESENIFLFRSYCLFKTNRQLEAIELMKKHQETLSPTQKYLCQYIYFLKHTADIRLQRTAMPSFLQKLSQFDNSALSQKNLFLFLSIEDISPKQHRAIATKVAPKLDSRFLPYAHTPCERNRLRIGYLSPDFRNHPVAHLMLGIFKAHDRSRFEIFAYNIGKEDHTSYRYRSILYMDEFRNLGTTASPEAIARQIATDKIDVLVDLCGYTDYCKPTALCFKPAPVMISYLGFVGTMGLPQVDYILADKIVLPPESAKYFTEKPLYLPRCYQATDGTLEVEAVTRAEMGLPETGFIFASFNNSYKFTPRCMDMWAKILLANPKSFLWLYASGLTRQNLLEEFTSLGVESTRLLFFERQSKARFLGALALADLFLDSSPYNAGTTASDALFAGCPVLTLPGETYSSRMCASIVTHAGLPELVCASEAEYISMACRMAQDAVLYQSIRKKAQAAKYSRLFDTTDATKCLEAAYRTVYDRFASGKKPAPLTIPEIWPQGWQNRPEQKQIFAGEQLSRSEVEAITAKVRRLGGDGAVAKFMEHISIVHREMPPHTITRTETMPQDTTLPETLSSDQIANFFTPVFWGAKDPEVMVDLMRMAVKQCAGYHFSDNLFCFQRNNSMFSDASFVKSWKENCTSQSDQAIVWRRYILAMAAFHCSHLEGDFVECGCYEGTGTKTVLDYLGGPDFPKTCWLYDLFEYPENAVHHSMPALGPGLHAKVCARFEQYPNVRIIKGALPDSLCMASPDKIAWLHLDLNQAPAEIGCLDALFDRIVPGGMIILDDYEYLAYRAQKLAEDEWLGQRGYKVFPLPTSQGLVIKR